MMLNDRVAASLRAARKRARYRLADIASLLPGMGLGRSHLCKLEQGQAEWTTGKIEALCTLYGVPVGEVLR